ncbi:M48 family metallopeptidase [Acidobacteriia bacterium AH_259_A11_L15]|nr:M48 family metallopeptidase [Acidobacteriia bacterium AH_259_A11_L15]
MHQRQSSFARQVLSLALILLLAAPAALADRTRLKPGFNLFSAQQDIELGQAAARDAERQLPLLNVPEVDAYLNRLGRRLAQFAPGHNYPYQFKGVNQDEINAFALPGGFLYLNRGTIDAANTEAELAGVMAHEIAHVSLRHGTNQLSKAYIAQFPLAILGGALGGGGGVVEQLVGLGIQVGFTSVFLKFSRTAETQADVLGTQILWDAGYDPQGLIGFFDTLQKRHPQRSIEFFSSHPNPENRQERIGEEIERLGPLQNPRRDSEDFHAIQEIVRQLPPPPKRGQRGSQTPQVGRPAEAPSRRFHNYRHRDFVIGFPDNWEVHEAGTRVLFAPPGGAGEQAIAYGVLVDVLDLDDPRASLEEATEHLVRQILQADPNLREVGHQRGRIDGRRALITQLRGPSPIQGDQETDYLFTVRLREGLFFALFIVPESDSGQYQAAFQQMLNSIRFR